MKRREFITLVGGTAAMPIVARAQQAALPVIGYLHAQFPDRVPHLMAAYRQGLGDAGFVDRRNVAIEYRAAEGRVDRLPGLAEELVRLRVAVITATGGAVSALAAKAATSTIPIVFLTGDDPVKRGLVTSFNRPSGNLTGVHVFQQAVEAKRLGLLRELVPTATSITALLNPRNAAFQTQVNEIQDAARAGGLQATIVHASNESEIDAAFARHSQERGGPLMVGADPYFNAQRNQITALAARHAIPTIYEAREFAVAGGLLSYGTSVVDGYRQVGQYTGRILKGEKPADLPVISSTKFELVMNLKAAKAIGLIVPPMLLARADEVIE